MSHRFAELRRNFNYCTYDGLAAMPMVFLLTPGNFVIAALLTGLYQLPPDTYGLIVSLPFWCNFLQLGVTPFLARRVRPQIVAAVSALLQLLLFGALALAMNWLPLRDPHTSGRWFILFFGLLGVSAAFAAVGWTSWTQEWVPEKYSGKYFGIRNQVLQIATVAFLLTVGKLLDHYHGSVLAFQLVILGAVLTRMLSAWYQYTMRTPPPAIAETGQRSWREQFSELRATPSLLWFIAFGAAWGFAANCIGPFYPVFLYQQLGLSVDHVGVLTVLVSVGGILSYPAWGLLANRFGNKPVIFFAMITWQVQNFLWCVLTPDTAWLLYAMWIFGGVMSAGVLLGMFNLLLKLIPPSAKTAAISVNIAVSSMVTAIAPILGGRLLSYLLASGHDAFTVYHSLFALQPILAGLACFVLLSRVREPRSYGLTTVFGAMRNVRTLGSIFGLTYLVNFVFIKNQKR